jgi:hypothetical protein
MVVASLPVAAAALASTKHDQLRLMGRVMALTNPQETVMDGWRGYGVFRPHAAYHAFLHEEIRSLLSESQRRQLAESLETGRLAPKVALLDGDLLGVSPEVKGALRAWYRPSHPVDRLIAIRRQQPVRAPGEPLGHQAKRLLAELWAQPGTAAAAVTALTTVTAAGAAEVPGPQGPMLLATWRQTGADWHVVIRVNRELPFPTTTLVAAFPAGRGWREAHLTGRQQADGNWETALTLPGGPDLPPWFLVRPQHWRDWFAIGLPVSFDKGGPTDPAGTLQTLAFRVPSAAGAGPMNLPGNRGWSPWEAGEPWHVPPAGLAWNLQGTLLFHQVRPGQTPAPRSTWQPLAGPVGGPS